MDGVVAILLTVILGFVVKFSLFLSKNSNEPPCISGWIPWIGAALQFGKAPLEFIEQARLKVILLREEGENAGLKKCRMEAQHTEAQCSVALLLIHVHVLYHLLFTV